MKKTVLIFGFICGAMLSLMMAATVPFIDRIGFENGQIVGYTTMLVAFLMIFFGIRSYRENVAGGTISFGRAFSVGILIMLIGTVFYVATWLIIYFNFMPDFADKYINYLVEKQRAAGVAPEVIAAETQKMQKFKVWLNNPFINGAIAFLEPLPIGLPVTLLSAAILRKKPK